MSIPSNRTRTIVLSLILIVGLITVVFALKMRQDSPKPKQHQAFVEEKQPDVPPPAEEKPVEKPALTPAEEPKVGDLELYNNMAADAVFGSFETATWECYDNASKTYFVYFESLKSGEEVFKYSKGWNIMGTYTFIVLGNGTAALKIAGDFSPISFETKGLDCHERGK
jgi:hypothetical protein